MFWALIIMLSNFCYSQTFQLFFKIWTHRHMYNLTDRQTDGHMLQKLSIFSVYFWWYTFQTFRDMPKYPICPICGKCQLTIRTEAHPYCFTLTWGPELGSLNADINIPIFETSLKQLQERKVSQLISHAGRRF